MLNAQAFSIALLKEIWPQLVPDTLSSAKLTNSPLHSKQHGTMCQ
jgi:hypothetical protein